MTSRAHKQEQVQIALAALLEESMRCLHRSVLDSSFLKLLLDFVVDLLDVLRVKQRSELTHIQDVINVLDETFLLDVLVRELEDDLLVVDT